MQISLGYRGHNALYSTPRFIHQSNVSGQRINLVTPHFESTDASHYLKSEKTVVQIMIQINFIEVVILPFVIFQYYSIVTINI